LDVRSTSLIFVFKLSSGTRRRAFTSLTMGCMTKIVHLRCCRTKRSRPAKGHRVSNDARHTCPNGASHPSPGQHAPGFAHHLTIRTLKECHTLRSGASRNSCALKAVATLHAVQRRFAPLIDRNLGGAQHFWTACSAATAFKIKVFFSFVTDSDMHPLRSTYPEAGIHPLKMNTSFLHGRFWSCTRFTSCPEARKNHHPSIISYISNIHYNVEMQV